MTFRLFTPINCLALACLTAIGCGRQEHVALPNTRTATTAAPMVAATQTTAATSTGSAVSSPIAANGSDLYRRSLGSKTDTIIGGLQKKLKQSPDDAQLLATLGQAYLQKIRETSDPSYYALADATLQKAVAIAPSDPNVIDAEASLLLGRHDFEKALEWGKKAVKQSPRSASAYALLGDAQVELGKYDDATNSFQQAVDLRPSLTTYSRVSYIEELLGNLPAAVQTMQMAAEAGSGAAENTAWCRVQLGNLYMKLGKFKEAEVEFRHALAGVPDYLHAEAGLASLRAAQGKSDEAIALYEKATKAVPFPAYLVALGDLYAKTGRAADAAREYQLVDVIDRLYQSNGVGTDLEMALFEADRGTNLPDALQRARREYERHPTVRAADALSWTLYRSGKFDEAADYSTKALHLGTKEPLYFYHAAKIALARGHKSEARRFFAAATANNPNFSVLYAEDARNTLTTLKNESKKAEG